MSYLWQAIVGLPILLLIFTAHILTPSFPLIPPDGIMRVHQSVVTHTDGQYAYTPNLSEIDVFGEWRLGPQAHETSMPETQAHFSCVWLSDNKVSLINPIYNDALGAMNYEARFKQFRRHGRPLLKVPNLGTHKTQSMKDLIASHFKAVDIIYQRQDFRPLTPAERARFLTEQACRKDMSHYGHHRTHCEHQWYIDWERYNETPLDQLDTVIKQRLADNSAEFE